MERLTLDPLVGTSVSHYEVIERLPETHPRPYPRYRAEDMDGHIAVTLELVPRSWSPTARERVLEKARRLLELDDPPLATLLEAEPLADGRVLLCWSHEMGETLLTRLERGPLELSPALWLLELTGRGLVPLHRAGLSHTSLRPEHLFLDQAGGVRLFDFGLSRMGEGLGEEEDVLPPVSVLRYLAPEAIGSPNADLRSDIWALGVLLYEMLTGALPFDDAEARALAHSIRTRDPQPLGVLESSLPPELHNLLHRTLAKRPEERYPDVESVLADLATLRPILSPADPKPQPGPVPASPPKAADDPPRAAPDPEPLPQAMESTPGSDEVRMIDLFLLPTALLLLLVTVLSLFLCRQ